MMMDDVYCDVNGIGLWHWVSHVIQYHSVAMIYDIYIEHYNIL